MVKVNLSTAEHAREFSQFGYDVYSSGSKNRGAAVNYAYTTQDVYNSVGVVSFASGLEAKREYFPSSERGDSTFPTLDVPVQGNTLSRNATAVSLDEAMPLGKDGLTR
ncbi:MAG: hypothetical protein IJO11_01305 [Alphaproteobacteria bacterium]|nr:hypothetical protein [Alphaproteobacteria bacterium]